MTKKQKKKFRKVVKHPDFNSFQLYVVIVIMWTAFFWVYMHQLVYNIIFSEVMLFGLFFPWIYFTAYHFFGAEVYWEEIEDDH